MPYFELSKIAKLVSHPFKDLDEDSEPKTTRKIIQNRIGYLQEYFLFAFNTHGGFTKRKISYEKERDCLPKLLGLVSEYDERFFKEFFDHITLMIDAHYVEDFAVSYRWLCSWVKTQRTSKRSRLAAWATLEKAYQPGMLNINTNVEDLPV